MQRKKTFQLFVVLGLLITLPLATAYFARQGFELRISALEDDTPTHVVISDVSGNSFRVSWITERAVIGGILLSSQDRFAEDSKSSYHSIEIPGLKTSTEYKFELLSGTKEFKADDEKQYSVMTNGAVSTGKSYLVYGQVFSPDGFSVQQGGIITMRLESDTLSSQILSTTINEAGGYQFDIAGLLSKSLSRNYPYQTKVTAVLTVYISHEKTQVEKRHTVDFSINRQIPIVYLGDVNIDLIPAIDGT